MTLTETEAGKLLWTYGADISRFVNALDVAGGVTVYDAEWLTSIEPRMDGYLTVGEFVDLFDAQTYYLELHPQTGHIRESF